MTQDKQAGAMNSNGELSILEAIKELKKVNKGEVLPELTINSLKTNGNPLNVNRKKLIQLLSETEIEHLTLVNFPYFMGSNKYGRFQHKPFSKSFHNISSKLNTEHLTLKDSFNLECLNISNGSFVEQPFGSMLSDKVKNLEIICTEEPCDKFIQDVGKYISQTSVSRFSMQGEFSEMQTKSLQDAINMRDEPLEYFNVSQNGLDEDIQPNRQSPRHGMG